MKLLTALAALPALAYGAAYVPHKKHQYGETTALSNTASKQTYSVDLPNTNLWTTAGNANTAAFQRAQIANTWKGEVNTGAGTDTHAAAALTTENIWFATSRNGGQAFLDGAAQTCSSCADTNYQKLKYIWGKSGSCPKANCADSKKVADWQGNLVQVYKTGVNSCTTITCQHNVHCPLGSCTTVDSSTLTCTCPGNQDTATKCATCKSGYSNWPYCSHIKADFDADTAICNGADGTKNANFFQATEQTQCGPRNSCGPTEQCCKAGAPAHYKGGFSYQPSLWSTTWATEVSADAQAFCADKSFTCCGTKACGAGQTCFDPARSICLTIEQSLLWAGHTPCYGGAAHSTGALLNNGTRITHDDMPAAWCSKFETCCDGVCCHKSLSCEKRGQRTRGTDTLGWDDMIGKATGGVYRQGAKWCNTRPFNAFHAMRIVVLPLFLTFAYLLSIVLGLKSGAPGPVKILSVVLLVLCIFNSYSHYWKAHVFIGFVATLTLWAQGNGDAKPSWTKLFITIVHVYFFFSVINYNGTNQFLTQNLNLFQRLSDTGGAVAAPTAGSPTTTDEKNRYQSCFNEFSYFYTDHNAIDGWISPDAAMRGWAAEPMDMGVSSGAKPGAFWAAAVQYSHSLKNPATVVSYLPDNVAPTGGFFGYCLHGWLATLEFFHAVGGFLVMALVLFSAKANFGDGGADGTGGGNKVAPVAQEVEVP
jgi:hypothetical protein